MQSDITLEKLITFLRTVEGFQEIPESDLGLMIAPLVGISKYEPGQYVIKKGSLGTNLFVLYDGEAHVDVRKPSGELILAIPLEVGSLVGEMSLVSNQPRGADIIADSKATFLTVDIETFQHLMMNDWRFTKAFAGIIGHRVVNQYKRGG